MTSVVCDDIRGGGQAEEDDGEPIVNDLTVEQQQIVDKALGAQRDRICAYSSVVFM